MRRTLVLIAVLGLLAAMATPAVGAPPGYEPVETVETAFKGLNPEPWPSGGGRVLHLRDHTMETTIEGHENFIGTSVLEANFNLNTVTGKGNLWGSCVYSSEEHDDSGWEGTWHGQWTGGMTWAGSGVARGYGKFEGMQWRFDVSRPGEPEVFVTSGYVFTPGSR